MKRKKSVKLWSCFVLMTTCFAVNCFGERISGVFHSEILDRDINYVVVVPSTYSIFNTNRIYPVVYALHGAGGDANAMTSMPELHSAIEQDYPAIIVGFDANGYTAYMDFFFDEFIPFIESEYRAGRSSGMRAVFGFSAGGSGSFHYVLEKPDFFSSVVGIAGSYGDSHFDRIAQHEANGVELPPIYLYCGSEDSLLDRTYQMDSTLTDHGYEHGLEITEGGIHQWSYVNSISGDILAWQYSFFSESSEEDRWRNEFDITNDLHANTGHFLGWLYVENDPWVFSYNLDQWVYVFEGNVDRGAWMWIGR